MENGVDHTGLVLEKQNFTELTLDEMRVSDSSCNKCDFTGTDLEESSFTKTTFTGCKFTGANFAKVYLNKVTFEECKLDYTSFMSAELKSVTFKNCVITDVMFAEAEIIKKLDFNTCTLERIDFRAVQSKQGLVDLRTSTLSELWGVSSVGNVTIAPEQLVQIAPVLALEAGIKILEVE